MSIRQIAAQEAHRQREWVAAIRGFVPAATEVLKEDGPSSVYRMRLLGREVVLKQWVLDSPIARIKTFVRFGRGDRHWRGARTLVRLGIPTAVPLILAGDANRQILLMEALPGKTLLEHLAGSDLTLPEEHALSSAIGALAAQLHDARCFNRDGKPSNLIVMATSPQPRIAIIDCVAIRTTRTFAKTEYLERMLASLVIEPLGCGCLPRRSLLMRALHGLQGNGQRADRAARHALWRAIRTRVLAHGDPTPRVLPLPAGPRLAQPESRP